MELLEPLGASSPIAAFLAKNPSGGLHHVCYEVADIRAAAAALTAAGARVLGDGEPKIGAHGKPVLFIHPRMWAACSPNSKRFEAAMGIGSAIAIYFIVWC